MGIKILSKYFKSKTISDYLFLESWRFMFEMGYTYQLKELYLGESITFKNNEGSLIYFGYDVREYLVFLKIKKTTTVLLDFNSEQFMVNSDKLNNLSEFNVKIKELCKDAKSQKKMLQNQFLESLMSYCADFLKENIYNI